MCQQGYGAMDCSVECPNRCSGHGDCLNGTCGCTDDYYGVDCSLHQGNLDHEALQPDAKAHEPLGISTLAIAGASVVLFFAGYAANFKGGLRGTDAIPFYKFLSVKWSGGGYERVN